MPNLNAILKAEMSRVARKELKTVIDQVRTVNARHRKEIAELKRQLASLQRNLKALSKSPKASDGTGTDTTGHTRFSAKGLKSTRARLGISAAEFGLLVGVTGQSIYKWESGSAVPRATQLSSLAAIRGIGKREAARRLAALG